MGSFSIWHWLIVLVIILLIFGTKKLRNVGQDLGGGVNVKKDDLKEGEAAAVPDSTDKPAQPEGARTIEGEATKR